MFDVYVTIYILVGLIWHNMAWNSSYRSIDMKWLVLFFQAFEYRRSSIFSKCRKLSIEGLLLTQIKERLYDVYKESASSYSAVKNWERVSSWERNSKRHWPRRSTCGNAHSRNDCSYRRGGLSDGDRLKIREIPTRLSKSTIHRMIDGHEKNECKMGFEILSAVQKQESLCCASEFLDLCGENSKNVI